MFCVTPLTSKNSILFEAPVEMVVEEVSIRYAAVVKQNQYKTDSFFVDHAMLARDL